MPTTRLSSSGRVCIPKQIREARAWQSGQEFEVVETAEGILLRPRYDFPETQLDEVGAALNYTGPTVPIERLRVESLPYRDPYEDDHDGP